MDIPKLANRFSELYASYSKKTVAVLEKQLAKSGFGDKHRQAAGVLRDSAHTLREFAFSPSKAEQKALEAAGVAVRVMKDKSWESCLAGYKIVSDLRGGEATMTSNGFVLEKGGDTFFASCVDSYDVPQPKELGGSVLESFTESFANTLAVTKHASKNGVSLPIVDSFVCFHSEGFFGCIIYKGAKSMRLWHDFVTEKVKGDLYSPKNRAVVAGINAKIAPVAKAKMDKIHDQGIIFAFNGYGWLDSSGIVLDFGADAAVPTEIFPLNYISSVMVSDIVKNATLKDYRILEHLQNDRREAMEKHKLVVDLVAVDLTKEGLIKT